MLCRACTVFLKFHMQQCVCMYLILEHMCETCVYLSYFQVCVEEKGSMVEERSGVFLSLPFSGISLSSLPPCIHSFMCVCRNSLTHTRNEEPPCPETRPCLLAHSIAPTRPIHFSFNQIERPYLKPRAKQSRR